MPPRLAVIHALSPLHAGTGQSIGAVDLAIARERATGMPYLPGSSLKGSLRDKAQRTWAKEKEDVAKIFGPETANASEHAGALVVGDANLLFLPVRSIAGTFAWVTSPYLLGRFARDARECGHSFDVTVEIPGPQWAKTPRSSSNRTGEKVFFEDLDFDSQDLAGFDDFAKTFAERVTGLPEFGKRICVVHDDVMSFLCQHAMDVATRVSLEAETKTAKDGQLWTEENLPSETLLVSVLAAMPNGRSGTEAEIYEKITGVLKDSIQLGGKATVGRGRCAITLF